MAALTGPGRMCRGIFLSLILLGGLPPAALSLSPSKAVHHFVYDEWTVRNGLPQNNINVIMQTRDGFIWIGTEEGLTRFDGLEFRVPGGGGSGIGKHDILAVHQARDRSLWVGSSDGLLQVVAGELVPVSPAPRFGPVFAITEDARGRIWIGSETGIWIGREGHFHHFRGWGKIARVPILSILEDEAGRMWFLARGGRLLLLQEPEDAPVSDGALRGIAEGAVAVSAFPDGGIVYYSLRHGLRRIGRGSIRPRDYSPAVPHMVRGILADRDGVVWLGTVGGGLYRWWHGAWETLTSKHGLALDVVETLFEDREKNIWIGTRGGGLCRLSDRAFITYSESDGLENDFVLCVYEDKGGRLWTGTNKGLYRYNNGFFFPFGESTLGRHIISALHSDQEGRLWAAAYGSGLFRHGDDGWVNVADRFPGLNLMITSILGDGDRGLWIATSGKGLFRLSGDRLDNLTTRQGLSSDVVLCLLKTRSGRLWVGTSGGLTGIENGRIIAHPIESALRDRFVHALYEDEDQNLWICTYGGGLKRWNSKELTTFSVAEGFPTDKMYSIVDDGRGRFWIGTGKGIVCVSMRDLSEYSRVSTERIRCRLYDEADGMKTRECLSAVNQQRAALIGDGRVAFATTRGLTAFFPPDATVCENAPAVVLDRLVVDGRPFPLEDVVSFPPGTDSFRFHFSLIDFYSPTNHRYRYRLDGWDKDWIYGDQKTEQVAHYSSLPPGRYRFLVAAVGKNSEWGDAEEIIGLELKAFFYQKPVFQGAASSLLMIFSLIIAAAVRKNIRKRRSLKYQSSTLSRAALLEYRDRVIKIMEKEQLFKEPDVNIKQVADRLAIPSVHLSQTLNICQKQNFNQFINHYRVEEAKKLLTDEKYFRLKIISLGFEVGFNSKSSFNRVFKQLTGMTPSDFRSRHTTSGIPSS